LCLLAGCATATAARSPVTGLGGSADGPELARQALARWSTDADPAAADALLDAAAHKDPHDPLVELGRLLLARRRLDDRTELQQALELIERHPERPEARIASASLERLAGTSTTLDQGLLLGVAGADLERADPVVAQRLRDIQAELLVARNEFAEAQIVREGEGLVQGWSLVGPLSPYHWLDFDKSLGPELTPDATSFSTPWGREAWRQLRFFNGWIPVGHDLEARQPGAGENRPAPPTGDLFYARATVESGDAGLLLRLESTASVRLFVDGQPVLVRDAFRRQRPRSSWIELPLPRGPHRLLVKIAAGDASAGFRVLALPMKRAAEAPLDGEALAAALSAAVDPKLGPLLAAEDLRLDDPSGALAMIERAAGKTPSRLALSLRADLWSALGTLGDEEARGRSRRDLDALVALDAADGSARLRRAGLEIDQGQLDAAEADLEAVPGTATPRLEAALARLRIGQEAGALAQGPLRRALADDPGYCPALELDYGLADQANAFASLDQTVEALARCPGGQAIVAQVRARRLGPTPLVRYWRGRLERSPGDPHAAEELAEALVAANRPGAAIEAIRGRLAAWPEDLDGWRRLGALQSLAGDRRAATEAYQRLLELDPADLPLRRALALQDGHDVLDGVLPTTDAALAAPLWTGAAKAPTTTRLDAGAAWLHPDGSVTERVRTIERILDEGGLQQSGELELPAGAQLKALRTHKRDGRILDAEANAIGEKGTISTASLEVGDDLEIDYLLSSPPSRRGQGGAAEPFYFEASDSSLQRSIYVVQSDRAPTIDAHRVDQPDTTKWSGTLTVERREVPALVAEPGAPPATEYFPWVQVGTGTSLQDLARSVADQLASRAIVDEGIRALAAEAKGLTQLEVAESLWALVSARIRGAGGALGDNASVVVARSVGDRLLPMKAALAARGIRSEIVLVSGPQASTEPRRFPVLTDYTDALLRIEPVGSESRWLAPGVRYAPFGQLPPWLCARPAMQLPESDADGRAFTLPPCLAGTHVPAGGDDHRFRFKLAMRADGSLHGEGQETLGGFEAAAARASLEQLDEAQRHQAVEAALAAGFRGATLDDLKLQSGDATGDAPGSNVVLDYRFTAEELARPEAAGAGRQAWSLPLRAFPLQLAASFLQLAARDLPLLISAWQRPAVELELDLPPGAQLEGIAAAPVALDTPFGSYQRTETRTGTKVQLRERLVLPPQRVPPGKYADFASFAAAVDRAEDERLTFSLPR
jgi:tetratricopeptide (TPR) repeat protein